jgi:hypothetical protein
MHITGAIESIPGYREGLSNLWSFIEGGLRVFKAILLHILP